jgi:xylan 1,4-beta-xylosidase
MIRNPILPEFNPDPSICRVGEDYYIATSTFEWFPGVQIHHSRDLVNRRLIRRPLERAAQLDMRGEPDSCKIWAPCLSYADGKFWLVYTDVKRFDGNFKDAHNYIVTAPTIEAPWSDPVHVNSSGFDPSLFHDDDGRKWFLNMVWNHRDRAGAHLKHPAFFGILLQEWDSVLDLLIGPMKNLFRRQLARPGRRPASLQARRLVLFDDGRGRHGLRSRHHDGAGARHRRSL